MPAISAARAFSCATRSAASSAISCENGSLYELAVAGQADQRHPVDLMAFGAQRGGAHVQLAPVAAADAVLLHPHDLRQARELPIGKEIGGDVAQVDRAGHAPVDGPMLHQQTGTALEGTFGRSVGCLADPGVQTEPRVGLGDAQQAPQRLGPATHRLRRPCLDLQGAWVGGLLLGERGHQEAQAGRRGGGLERRPVIEGGHFGSPSG
jgi:hypothetical protein